MTDAPKCPHCGEELGLEVVSRALEDSRMSFSLTPKEGSLMMADTIGGTLVSMAKMLQAVGKELGVKTKVLVEKVTGEADGTVKFDLLISRFDKAKKQ